jgi:hypothetical protein
LAPVDAGYVCSVSNHSLLVLVADDPLAPAVVASWKALGPKLADIEAVISKITIIARAGSVEEVRRTLERCQLATLLVDGGITPLAESWLSAHVGKHLGIKPKAPTPAAKTTPKPVESTPA